MTHTAPAITGITRIDGIAAALPIDNLDTDQIMPKQFLRGIDKAGLADGLLWDLRFDAGGRPRADFVLNRPAYAATRILIGGPNFGCGSSREHAVWGLLQYGIQAVIAPSFGEIFYSNAMNNRLLALMLPAEVVAGLSAAALEALEAPLVLKIDLGEGRIEWADASAPSNTAAPIRFTLAERHRQLFIDGLDAIGSTSLARADIAAFAARQATERPWLADLGTRIRSRLTP